MVAGDRQKRLHTRKVILKRDFKGDRGFMENSDEFTNSIRKPAVGKKQERLSVVEHAWGTALLVIQVVFSGCLGTYININRAALLRRPARIFVYALVTARSTAAEITTANSTTAC